MRLLASTLALALTVAGASSAATNPRLTDAQFLHLARCAGLVDGSGADATPFDAALRENRARRAEYIRDQARLNRSTAATNMRRASGVTRERLEAEKAACAV